MSKNSGAVKGGKPRTALMGLIALSVAGLLLALIVLFNHVLSEPSDDSNEQPMDTLQPTPLTVPSTPTSTPAPTPKPTPTPEPTDYGAFGPQFGHLFAKNGMVQSGENFYRSEDIYISIEKHEEDRVTYYVADIYIRELDCLKTAFASGEFSDFKRAFTQDIAKANDAILAVSGDFCQLMERGIVIRNGELCRSEVGRTDTCVIYNDGTMETLSKKEADLEKIINRGAYQTWCFGPELLDGGKAISEFPDSQIKPKNPRCAIGYYEPGHYCLVLVDGRQPGYSVGMTLAELSDLFFRLGCKSAYNLDGGRSASMYFMGKLVSRPYDGGRKMGDIAYIREIPDQ